ncbi:SCO family protein [Thalassotalea sediminis]|uniref:SCO family protein n=1 Tax=Thalassotalea sediminis TaxID=1759089 RepID=UPI0025722658|nr:SCO family protein [Thalassotalea sediminis]
MNKFLIIIVACVALACGTFLYKSAFDKPLPEHSLYYQTPRNIEPFSMTAHTGDSFGKAQLAGKWSWVFFGYTSCPDVCPTTLQELNFSYDELKKVADNTQVLLVSVDPQRDSVARLAEYIAYFNKEFIALSADHSVLFPFARNLGLMYAITDEAQGSSYLVDHSASIVLINPQGKIAAIFKPNHEVGQVPTISGEQLVSDFTRIVALER